jgi:Protein of unknown function (DUF3761)
MSDQEGQPPQWPPQPPYEEQQSFYTQPTQPYPGQFPRPPYNSFPPQQKRKGVWGWYKSRTRKIKLGIGCGIILALLLCFACIGTAIGVGNLAATQTPTPTASTAHAAAVIQRPTATYVPLPTPSPTHQPAPTQPPKPTSPPCQAINGNPWCYTFVPGNLIYNPPSGFCSYFTCIPSFYQSDDPGDGYIVQCSDGTYSQSGGERGACSRHGGVTSLIFPLIETGVTNLIHAVHYE